MKYSYNHVAVAGTFDRLHAGHKALLEKAFECGDKITVALTTEVLTQDKFLSSTVQSYSERKKNLIKYLETHHYKVRATIVELKDIYGISKYDKTLDGIVVTDETYPNALKINAYRRENNLPELNIISVPFAFGPDKKIISSSRIRAGEIDRNGVLYGEQFRNKVLVLPLELRERLRTPIGLLISGQAQDEVIVAKKVIAQCNKLKPPLVISVGDIITHSLLENEYIPDIAVIDLKTRRDKTLQNTSSITDTFFVNNPGTINKWVFNRFTRIFSDFLVAGKKQIIYIKGEEDLLVLPAILLAPLQSIILYGQFDQGVVLVVVTEKLKENIKSLLLKFTVTEYCEEEKS